MAKTRHTVTHPDGTASTRTSGRSYSWAIEVEFGERATRRYEVWAWSGTYANAERALREARHVYATARIVPVETALIVSPAEPSSDDPPPFLRPGRFVCSAETNKLGIVTSIQARTGRVGVQFEGDPYPVLTTADILIKVTVTAV